MGMHESCAFFCFYVVPVLTQLLPCYLYANLTSKKTHTHLFLGNSRRFHLSEIFTSLEGRTSRQPRCNSTTPSASEPAVGVSAISAEVVCTCRKQLGTLLGVVYIYIIYILYIYMYIPGPSKGVKFQPPGPFLAVKGLKFQTLGGFRYVYM